MPTIQDLPLEIQQMIVQHATYMPRFILYTTPSDLQQVYAIYLQLKIVDNRVILHCINEFRYGKELEYFKTTETEEIFAVTSVPKKKGVCETEEDGEYLITDGVMKNYLYHYDSDNGDESYAYRYYVY